jgi:hypothetical protein
MVNLFVTWTAWSGYRSQRTGGPPTEPNVNLPHSVAEILQNHVTLQLESIDRMYLNLYVPSLQYEGGVVKFFRGHRGQPIASSALMSPMTNSFVAATERFAEEHQIPLIPFEKHQRKEAVMAEQLRHFDQEEGVVFLGKAQEKAPVFRTEKRRNPQTGQRYPWIVRSTAMVNHYYWYCVDRDFGPFFLKFCSYFPYTAKLCVNGHEYAKRQLEREGISYQALDRPLSGRIFFEEILRENLDLGRPDQVQLIFDRRVNPRTPGRFRTRVLTEGVIPSLLVDYKSSRIKQYFKQVPGVSQVGARTETTVNNPRDFYLGKRLGNLPALRQVGFQANRRLLEVERLSHDCAVGEEILHQLNRPLEVNGQRTSALRTTDLRVLALWHVLVWFRLLPCGFSNHDLREQVAVLTGQMPTTISQGRMTYDLRRLRLHGMIQRIPKTHRYRITPFGLRAALFFTRAHARLYRPSVTQFSANAPPVNARLALQFQKLEDTIHTYVQEANLAA